jgi:hypothetical protein
VSNDTSVPPTAPTKDSTPPGLSAVTYVPNDLPATVSKTPSIVSDPSAPAVTSWELNVVEAPRERTYSACSEREEMMPITSAPCAFAIATAAEPTPPAGDGNTTVADIANLTQRFECSYARQTQHCHLEQINVSGKNCNRACADDDIFGIAARSLGVDRMRST